jgi:cysteine synthase A
MLGAFRGYRVVLVGDTAIDPYLEARLRGLGATIDRIDPHSSSSEGPQVQRVRRVNDLLSSIPGSYWPSQYDNLDNVASYAPFARRLVRELGRIDYLVGTVGTGGSMSGTGLALRALLPRIRIVGVDTHNSVLFGHPPGNRLLRGLGNSLMPRNVLHEVFDEIHWVTAAEAYAAANDLHREHALFMGGTSGAAYLVARWIHRHDPRAQIVALLPDPGHRYVDTVYNPGWLAALPGWSDEPSSQRRPVPVSSPTDVMDRWSLFQWDRRPSPLRQPFISDAEASAESARSDEIVLAS